MSLKKLEAFIFCLILVSVKAYSENFKHITINEGLSNNAIYSIFQDSKGLMWFGSINGLHRYDGKGIISVNSKGPFLSSIIFAIQEDNKRKLWIGTDGGLFTYDLENDDYKIFDKTTAQGVKITSIVKGICIDSKNILWISTMGQGIFHYNQDKNILSQITQKDGLSSNNVKHIIEDRTGLIWITLMENGIFCYNTITKKLTPIKTPNHLKGWYSFEDSQAKIWIGSDKGLYLLDKNNKKITSILGPLTAEGVLEIKSIVEYKPNELLLATDEGLIIFNSTDCSYRIINKDKNNIHTLNDNYLHSLYIDKEKGLWIGSYFGGVDYLSPTSNNFDTYDDIQELLPGKIISVIEKDSKENLWIGTDDAGICYFDRKANTVTSYKPSQHKNSMPSYKNIHAIMLDDDNLYVGMYMGGLDIYNIKTKKYKHIGSTGKTNSLLSSSIYSIYKDNYGIIWIGTTSGMNIYNPSNDNISYIKELKDIEIRQIIEDKKGFLWVSTPYNGIFRYDRKHDKWGKYQNIINNSQSISSNYINTIAIDEYDNLWAGTNGNGICQYNAETDKFKNYEFNELPSKVIYSIIPDKGNLWLATTNGLIMFNPHDESYKVYNESDGLRSNQFSPRSSVKLNDGTIIVGSINGLNGFKPSELDFNNQQPEIAFTKFELFNKTVIPNGKESPLKKSIAYTKEITLKYDQTIFSIYFAALSYTKSYNNNYLYKLEGFDKSWTKTKEQKATYTNIAPGDYVFRVKASNGDDIWNNEGISLKIHILPPFWQSTPFIIFYTICITFIITYIFYTINKKHKRKMAYIKNEKDIELYNTKIEFFTNIIHEIRTPLTLILSPLEVIMSSSKESVDNILPQLQVIERNGKRIFSLVNQFMDFRKIEKKGIELHVISCDICKIVHNIYNSFKYSAEIKNIDMRIILPEQPCFAKVDEEAFTKIITNLLSNALKFTRHKIIIKVEENSSMILISITDDGIGISADKKHKIFEPFYQIKENLPSDYIGTGIGLHLVKELTQMLDGEIDLISEKYKGSTFIVKFKKGKAEDIPQKEENDTLLLEKIGNIKATTSVRSTLLIVDDNDDMLSYLQESFSNSFNVICSKSGKEALNLLKSNNIDIVISDIMMPIMNGYELCNKIKTNITTSHIPVVMLTAKVSDKDKIDGFEYGADAYVEKPFSISILKSQINSIIHNRELLKKSIENVPVVSVNTIANSEKDKEFLEKIEKYIEDHILEPEFSVNELAAHLCLGRSSFFNKMKALYDMTPNDFVRLVRLKKAAKLISNGETSVNNICYSIGFSSPSYFSKCFLQQFGMTPKKYINMKNKRSNKESFENNNEDICMRSKRGVLLT